MRIFRIYFIVAIILFCGVSVSLFSCLNMSKRPNNTLAIFENDNKIVYLIEINDIIPSELLDNIQTDNDYFINYTLLEGDYPANYIKATFFLHIIPEETYYKFKACLVSFSFFEKNKYVGHAEPNFEWVDAGTSKEKNNINTSIMDYYKINIVK
jgi:hypothetical protein